MTHVTKETAVLLKEKGFDVEVRKFYGKTNKVEITVGVLHDYNVHEYIVSAPTLHEAADWLRSKGVHVYVIVNESFDCWYFELQQINGKYFSVDEYSPSSDTHDLALEDGIIYALKNYVK